MPPKSKAQARLMRAAAAGKATKAKISKKKAKEYVEGHPIKGLPERKKKKKGRKGK